MQKSAILFGTCVLPLAAFASGCIRQSNASPQPAADVKETPRQSLAKLDDLPVCCKKSDPSRAAVESLVQPLPASPVSEKYRRSGWLEPDARRIEGVLDLKATDQDGRAFGTTDLRGRPIALSFLYTRCTNPNKCPLIAARMARLERLLEAEGLDTRVRLLIVTYDPAFDTPERLREYGVKHAIRFTPDMRMLRPDDPEKERLLDRLQVAVNYNAEGVNLHGIQLFLFDALGRFVRRYESIIWDNAEVLADLKRLAQEVR